MKWTTEMDVMLKSLIETRHSAATAATALSRSQHTTITRQALMGRAWRKGWRFDSESKNVRVTLTEPSALRNKMRPTPAIKAMRFNPADFGTRKPRLKPRPETSAPCEPAPIGPLNDFPIWGCRWIHGDPATSGWQCCATPTLPHSSYCAHHDQRTSNRLTSDQKRLASGKVPMWAA